MISLVSFNFPLLNLIMFSSIALAFVVASVYKFEWGMYVILFEIFLNSMGYIFYYEGDGFKISLRIAIWLLFMAIFLAKIIVGKINIEKIFKEIRFNKAFVFLGFFIVVALLNGLTNNSFGDVFSDFNSFLFFLLLLPFYYIFSEKSREKSTIIWQNIVVIFTSVILYICFKSLLFLFLFSHDLRPIISDLYSWTRLNLLGEITRMEDGFYRMFFQNQIFLLLAFLFSLSCLFFKKNKNNFYGLILLNSIILSVIIISFSRSFWVGLIASIFLLIVGSFFKLKTKKTILNILKTLTISIISLILIFIVIRFPWPKIQTDFSMSDISERASIKTEESAVSSRWALLDVMKVEIKENIFLGGGFGYRLEYKSSDPRVLETSADGTYSTYAFEWAWLDILLKMGIFGFISYILLFFLILKDSLFAFLKSSNYYFIAIFLSTITISVVNFFTPYLNHPLGITYLIIIIMFLDYLIKYDKNNSYSSNAN
ncbi:MAG: O-antigen ligase family protein [Patescibacteria group bacterium]